MTEKLYSIWRPNGRSPYGELYHYDEFIASGHVNDLLAVKSNHINYFKVPIWKDSMKRKYYEITETEGGDDRRQFKLTFGTKQLREQLATGQVLDLMIAQNMHQFEQAQKKIKTAKIILACVAVVYIFVAIFLFWSF